MSFCLTKSNCSAVAVIASIIIGAISAILTITAAITITPAFLWVVFGVAVVYLALLLIASVDFSGSPSKGCVCRALSVLLTGILGTILTSVILLGITFAATSVIGAIISGALLAFFSLIFTQTACLIKCLSRCKDAQ